MSFDAVLGHDHAKELITSALARDRLGHAYIFAGPDGVGKTLLALELARLLFCRSDRQRPCGECSDCHLVAGGGHPDFFIIQAEEGKRFITIDQARELSRMLSLKPVRAQRRIAIIREADRMIMEAANALLKTLEEPAPFAHLILTAAQPHALPSTIRSRCQKIRFGPLSSEQIMKVLSGLPEFDEAQARLAARFAHGSPGRAIQITESGCLEILEALLKKILALPEGDIFAISEVMLDWARGASRKLEPQRRRLRDMLDLLACAYRDIMLLQLEGTIEEQRPHADARHQLRPAERLTTSGILRVQEAIWAARRQIDANAAIPLVLENLLSRIEQVQAATEACAAR